MSGHLVVYWGKVGFSLRFRRAGKLVTLFDAYPDSLSVVKEEWVKEYAIPEDSYRIYRAEVSGIPVMQRTFGRGGRYCYYRDMAVEEVRTVLTATGRLAQAIVDEGQR